MFEGQDISKLNSRSLARFRCQHIGFVFQFHQLLPEFTALENVMIPALILRTKERDARQRAEELLGFMGFRTVLATSRQNSQEASSSEWPWREH